MTYADHEKQIYKAVHVTLQKFPGADFNDLLAEGNYIYLKALESFNGDKGLSFGQWLNFKLYRKLSSFASYRHKVTSREDGEVSEETMAKDSSESREDLISRFSDECQTVVRMALSIPAELNRGILRGMLKDMGWSDRKVTSVFGQIRSAI